MERRQLGRSQSPVEGLTLFILFACAVTAGAQPVVTGTISNVTRVESWSYFQPAVDPLALTPRSDRRSRLHLHRRSRGARRLRRGIAVRCQRRVQLRSHRESSHRRHRSRRPRHRRVLFRGDRPQLQLSAVSRRAVDAHQVWTGHARSHSGACRFHRASAFAKATARQGLPSIGSTTSGWQSRLIGNFRMVVLPAPLRRRALRRRSAALARHRRGVRADAGRLRRVDQPVDAEGPGRAMLAHAEEQQRRSGRHLGISIAIAEVKWRLSTTPFRSIVLLT